MTDEQHTGATPEVSEGAVKKITIDEGGMWESIGWEIHFDVEVEGSNKCRHCSPVVDKVNFQSDGIHTWIEQVCTCPRVIVVENEGGHATTGLCADCTLEALIALKESGWIK